MRKRTPFVCAYALFVALGVSGCGGGGIKEGMPADTTPNADLLKQEQEAGRLATEAATKGTPKK